MFEHFSAKAIEALNLAREEARRLEFAQVDTDHLLLGLLAEGTGAAAMALRHLGVDLRKARFAVEQLSGRGYMHVSSLFFSTDCQALFREAADAAGRSAPAMVDTCDLLLALLNRPRSRGMQALRHLGCEPEALHQAAVTIRAEDLTTSSPPEDPVAPSRFTPRLLTGPAREVYDLAFQMARAYGHALVGTEQLLIALLAVEGGLASEVLAANGLTRIEVEAVAHRIIGRGSGCSREPRLSFRAEAALDAAWREARSRSLQQVGTGHLLLGLLGLDAGGALTIMDQLKINLSTLQLDLEQAFDEQPSDPEPRPLTLGKD